MSASQLDYVKIDIRPQKGIKHVHRQLCSVQPHQEAAIIIIGYNKGIALDAYWLSYGKYSS
jgi:hypothetical protein